MPSARDLLEQADALMRSNRNVGGSRAAESVPVLTDVAVPAGSSRTPPGDDEIPVLTNIVTEASPPMFDLTVPATAHRTIAGRFDVTRFGSGTMLPISEMPAIPQIQETDSIIARRRHEAEMARPASVSPDAAPTPKWLEVHLPGDALKGPGDGRGLAVEAHADAASEPDVDVSSRAEVEDLTSTDRPYASETDLDAATTPADSAAGDAGEPRDAFPENGDSDPRAERTWGKRDALAESDAGSESDARSASDARDGSDDDHDADEGPTSEHRDAGREADPDETAVSPRDIASDALVWDDVSGSAGSPDAARAGDLGDEAAASDSRDQSADSGDESAVIDDERAATESAHEPARTHSRDEPAATDLTDRRAAPGTPVESGAREARHEPAALGARGLVAAFDRPAASAPPPQTTPEPRAVDLRELADTVYFQVLQNLDLYTERALQARLTTHLAPIIERASRELLSAINANLGALIRQYVADAIEKQLNVRPPSEHDPIR